MKICLFGNKATTESLIHEITNHGFLIDTLVILNAESVSKINISGYGSGLAELAKKKGINVYSAKSYSLKDDIDFFQAKEFDIGISTGWQRIIPNDILSCFRQGVFGWHGSGFRFPNGRGRSPLNWSIRLGLKAIHHNCFRYDAGADDGDVFDTHSFPIEEHDYIEDVQAKALSHIKDSVISLLEYAKSGPIPLIKQIEHPFIIFPALSANSGSLYPIRMCVSDALNIIRSCSRPFPGAFITLSEIGCTFRIWRAEEVKFSSTQKAPPLNNLVLIDNKLYISFKDGLVCSGDYVEEFSEDAFIEEGCFYECK